MTRQAERREPNERSIADLNTLRDRDDVEFVRGTRTFERRKFEALRDRYEAIDGVVMTGVTNDDGEVLLVGPDPWVPLGDEVGPGGDWAAAARRGVEELTGVAVEIDDVELVEESDFCLDGDEDSRFTAPCVSFSASLADDVPAFLDEPTVADDLDHPLYGDGEGVELGWFGAVPEDAHPNHVEHVRLFLE